MSHHHSRPTSELSAEFRKFRYLLLPPIGGRRARTTSPGISRTVHLVSRDKRALQIAGHPRHNFGSEQFDGFLVGGIECRNDEVLNGGVSQSTEVRHRSLGRRVK